MPAAGTVLSAALRGFDVLAAEPRRRHRASLGVPAFDLGEATDQCDALSHSPSEARLIRVPIGAIHHVLPMVAPGAANIDRLDHAMNF